MTVLLFLNSWSVFILKGLHFTVLDSALYFHILIVSFQIACGTLIIPSTQCLNLTKRLYSQYYAYMLQLTSGPKVPPLIIFCSLTPR